MTVTTSLEATWHCPTTAAAGILLATAGTECAAVIDPTMLARCSPHRHSKRGALDMAAFYTHTDGKVTRLGRGVRDVVCSVLVILDGGLQRPAGVFMQNDDSRGCPFMFLTISGLRVTGEGEAAEFSQLHRLETLTSDLAPLGIHTNSLHHAVHLIPSAQSCLVLGVEYNSVSRCLVHLALISLV